ncbi:thioesterase family protein [Streptomyces sp. NBC_01775]|uniref:thioesterase family protein n=1 Tax=Streptomyces sp. NBC_01775 TaxID=2975939 RepID=UPI002DD7B66D|nr:thioesterase family protein [Streptomyces sp. NBC_01775]WSB74830.1 thioesterase family protein [Streptomyces sp. NBC_01775]
MSTETLPVRAKHLLTETTRVPLRPRYEGSNICTWIGFKHVNYLVEEAVLEHFRCAGLPARGLYEEYGLGVDLVDLDTRIPHALHMDDSVDAEVVPVTREGDPVLRFRVTLTLERGGRRVKAATSKVRVSLRTAEGPGEAGQPPSPLRPYTVPVLGRHESASGPGSPTGQAPHADGDGLLERLTAGENAFGWKWRIPYPYCHFSERLQMSGYLRVMEEVVELFLADRGISIRQLLEARRWIPVVPHSRIQILDEVLMEEDLYTVYTVEEIFKTLTYTSRMDCYALRDGHPVRAATGRITHGYAVIDSRRDWSLVEFDDRVVHALSGPEPADRVRP